MGLFDAKYCSICGEKMSLMGNRKLEDGNMCKDCSSKLSPFMSDRRHTTIDEIKQHLQYREENKQRVSQFNPTMTLGNETKVYIDQNTGTFAVSSSRDWRSKNPDIINISQVSGVFTEAKEHKKEIYRKDSEGHNVSYNPRRYEYSYEFETTINVNSPYFDEIKFDLTTMSNRPKQVGDMNYRSFEQMGLQIQQALSPMNGMGMGMNGMGMNQGMGMNGMGMQGMNGMNGMQGMNGMNGMNGMQGMNGMNGMGNMNNGLGNRGGLGGIAGQALGSVASAAMNGLAGNDMTGMNSGQQFNNMQGNMNGMGMNQNMNSMGMNQNMNGMGMNQSNMGMNNMQGNMGGMNMQSGLGGIAGQALGSVANAAMNGLAGNDMTGMNSGQQFNNMQGNMNGMQGMNQNMNGMQGGMNQNMNGMGMNQGMNQGNMGMNNMQGNMGGMAGNMGTWTCEYCGTVNTGNVCSGCSNPKPF